MHCNAKDWHPEDIKAAIRKTGTTLEALGSLHGYRSSAVSVALIRPWNQLERIIAEHLGTKPQEIWPTRYARDGSPLHVRGRRPDRHRQKHIGART